MDAAHDQTRAFPCEGGPGGGLAGPLLCAHGGVGAVEVVSGEQGERARRLGHRGLDRRLRTLPHRVDGANRVVVQGAGRSGGVVVGEGRARRGGEQGQRAGRGAAPHLVGGDRRAIRGRGLPRCGDAVSVSRDGEHRGARRRRGHGGSGGHVRRAQGAEPGAPAVQGPQCNHGHTAGIGGCDGREGVGPCDVGGPCHRSGAGSILPDYDGHRAGAGGQPSGQADGDVASQGDVVDGGTGDTGEAHGAAR